MWLTYFWAPRKIKDHLMIYVLHFCSLSHHWSSRCCVDLFIQPVIVVDVINVHFIYHWNTISTEEHEWELHNKLEQKV